MTQAPTISIVTCSYQQGRFLDATMRSVLDQQYPGLEYIVMDGGSTDGSKQIIQRHADRLAHWVSEKDAGQTDALVRGFQRSTGDIQGWLCSDDLLLPGALQQVGSYFAQHPQVDVVYGDALWINEQGGYIRAKKEAGFNRFVFLFDHNYLPQPSVFWRRSLYERVGGLDTTFDLAMDSDLWDRFSQEGRIRHVAGYWSAMRQYPAQKTQALRPRGAKEDQRLRDRSAWASVSLLQPALRPLARGLRIATKLCSGGYGVTVPKQTVTLLKPYEILV
jgi:glycosyltransferase involved in cell wall biosynthesis